MKKSPKDEQKSRKKSSELIKYRDVTVINDSFSKDLITNKKKKERFTSVKRKETEVSINKVLESPNILSKARDTVFMPAKNVQVPVEATTTKYSAILGQLISYESSESESENGVADIKSNSSSGGEICDEVIAVPNSESDIVNDESDDHNKTVDNGDNAEPNRESPKSPDSTCLPNVSNEAFESNPSQDNLSTIAQFFDKENLMNILSAAKEICDKTPALVQSLNTADNVKPADELSTNPSNKFCTPDNNVNIESSHNKHHIHHESNVNEIREENICDNLTEDKNLFEETDKVEDFNDSTRPILIFIDSQESGKGFTIDTMDYCSNEVKR